MEILPVIDLKDGVVVHAVAGRRESYRPIASRLAPDAKPASIAGAYRDLGFDQVYVADLNALEGGEPDQKALGAIAASGLRLVLDAGFASVARIKAIKPFLAVIEPAQLVIALETMTEPELLADLLQAAGADRAVFSIDLDQGRLKTRISSWYDRPIIEVAHAAVELGFRSLLLLDTASVGTGRGVTLTSTCSAVRTAFPQIKLLSGGGVRHDEDLQTLAEAGCDVALVCTSLHNGELKRLLPIRRLQNPCSDA